MIRRDIRKGGSIIDRAADFALVMRRNSSWNAGSGRMVFGSLAALSVVIAAAFAALGAWPILPFAGIEVLVLGLAWRWSLRHAADFERVAVEGERVVLDAGGASGWRRVEFQRYWARLVVKESAPGYRIALTSHGREVEVGRYLGESRRRELARELHDRIAGR